MIRINNNMLVVLLKYLEEANVSVSGMQYNYDKENNKISFEQTKGLEDCTKREVTIKLDKEKSSVLIKEDVRYEYGFETYNDSLTPDTYNVDNTQKVVKFRVSEGILNIYTASITQTVKKDAMGRGDWIIAKFNSISDFINQENRELANINGQEISIEKVSYQVPKDYEITEGPLSLDSRILVNKLK